MCARKMQNALKELFQNRTSKWRLLLLAGAGAAAFAASTPAQARADGFAVAIGFNFGTPVFVAPPPVVYTPPVVVAPSQPVYAPAPEPYYPPTAPVAYTPQPVYTPAYAPQPADYYAQPIAAEPTPVVTYDPPISIFGSFGQGFGWGGDHRDGYHRDGGWQQRDHGGYRQAHFDQRPMRIQPRFNRPQFHAAQYDRGGPQHNDGGHRGFGRR